MNQSEINNSFFINFETPRIRHFYEQNINNLYEKTPSNKKLKIQLFQSPFSNQLTLQNKKKDLFSELLESGNKFISPVNKIFNYNSDAINYKDQQQHQMHTNNINQIDDNCVTNQVKPNKVLSQYQDTQQQSQMDTTKTIKESLCIGVGCEPLLNGNLNSNGQQYPGGQIMHTNLQQQYSSTCSSTQLVSYNTTITNAVNNTSDFENKQSWIQYYGQKTESGSSYKQDDRNSNEIRKRKRKNNQQLNILKQEFEKVGGYWNKEKILKVAKITGLSESQVYKWCWDQKKKRIDTFKKCIIRTDQQPGDSQYGNNILMDDNKENISDFSGNLLNFSPNINPFNILYEKEEFEEKSLQKMNYNIGMNHSSKKIFKSKIKGKPLQNITNTFHQQQQQRGLQIQQNNGFASQKMQQFWEGKENNETISKRLYFN